MELKHRFDVPKMLLSILGYKGIPYPGMALPRRPVGDYAADEMEDDFAIGTRLRQYIDKGRWFFMPVSFKYNSTNTNGEVVRRVLELPDAIISITGKKTIVETAMVERKGTVKELISVDDYDITIAAFLHTPGRYPKWKIRQMRNLYNLNESVELISALTDLVFDAEDRVVITNLEFPAPTFNGVEDGQAVKITCTTDRDFDLIIENK